MLLLIIINIYKLTTVMTRKQHSIVGIRLNRGRNTCKIIVGIAMRIRCQTARGAERNNQHADKNYQTDGSFVNIRNRIGCHVGEHIRLDVFAPITL